MTSRPLLLATLASIAFPACTCGLSHTPDGGGRRDAAAPTPDAAPVDGTGWTDGAAPDAGDGWPVGPPPCRMACSVATAASGYRPEGYRPAGLDQVEILASAISPGGALHVLLSSPLDDYGRVGWEWALATAQPGSASFDLDGERTWPSSPAAPDGWGRGLDAAILRASDARVEAVVLSSVRDPASSMVVRAGYVEWSADGARLQRAEDLGTVAVLPEETPARGTVFELPGGDVIAAVEHRGALQGVRVSWEGGAGPSIVDHLDLGATASAGDGMAPLSGVALDDLRWSFAGGGRSAVDTRPAFAHTVVGAVPAWTGTLAGSVTDPPPRIVRSGHGAVALRWRQSPRDIDDAVLVATRLSDSGPAGASTVPTPRLPMPRDAHVGSAETGAFAVWSVRAPDEFGDLLVHLVLLDRTEDCGGTEALAIGRLRGAAAAPSIHAAPVAGDLLVLGQPLGVDGQHGLTALRVRCEIVGD